MKLVLQRVNSASVTVDNQITGQINTGLLILLGISKDYNEVKLDWMVNKILALRLWNDKDNENKGAVTLDGRSVPFVKTKGFQKNITDINGEFLIVSQFTLFGDCTQGTKPKFNNSMNGTDAKIIYELFIKKLKEKTKLKVATGVFGAMMDVKLENSGPITIILEK